MILPLITPVGSNFVKDFPAQNAVNYDLLDAHARACLTSHPLKTYVPIITATTVNPVVGTGGPATLKGFYYEIFDQVFTWGEFRFGTSGSNAGSGEWAITLPFAVANTTGIGASAGLKPVIGTGSIWCNGTASNRQPVTVHLKSTTEILFSVKLNAGTVFREINHSAPIAWAPQDGLNWNAHYQRVAS